MNFFSVFVTMLVCIGFNLSFCQAANVSGNQVRFPSNPTKSSLYLSLSTDEVLNTSYCFTSYCFFADKKLNPILGR